MRLSPEVNGCIVFIGYEDNGRVSYGGTGFFVGVNSPANPDMVYLHVVTARHVVANLPDGELVLFANHVDGVGVELKLKSPRWWYHPNDSSADVAVLGWLPPEEIDVSVVPEEMVLDGQMAIARGVGPGDEVFVTGLFTSLRPGPTVLPIVRTGNVAMIPDRKIPTQKFGNMDAYLIEVRSLGGLSGSPVFLIEPENSGRTRRLWLLGLIHGHWDETSSQSGNSRSGTNAGIGVVTPAGKIKETLHQPALVDLRAQRDEVYRRRADAGADPVPSPAD